MPGDVTVVIPAYNRAGDLPITLQALGAQTMPPKDIIVIDNSSTDGTEGVVASWAPRLESAGVRLMYRRNEPLGPASARNLGWQAASTEYVAFVDSDVTLDRLWIEVVRLALVGSPDLGAVGGRLLYAHRPDLLNCFGGEMSRIGLAWDAEEGTPAASINGRRRVLWTNCSALMARRRSLEEVGGFEDDFFYGFEDSDLGWRLNLLGWRIEVLPEAIALHRVGQVIGRAAPLIVFHFCKNRLRSLLANWGASRLLVYAPLYLAYAITDLVLRPPRRPKVRALWWNLHCLPKTLAQRSRIQRGRRVSDADLEPLFSSNWFPKKRLSGLRRRPAEYTTALMGAESDDRV